MKYLSIILASILLASCQTPQKIEAPQKVVEVVVITMDTVDEACRTPDVVTAATSSIEACVWKLNGACTLLISSRCQESEKCSGMVEAEALKCPGSYSERLKKTIGYPNKKGLQV